MGQTDYYSPMNSDQQLTWQLDPSQSYIKFSVRHLMFSKVRGSFAKFSADVDYDEGNPANSSAVITVNTASVNTGDKLRDQNLRSPDLFHVANFPTAVFTTTGVKITGKNRGRIAGELTIRDKTNKIVVNARYLGANSDSGGTKRARFKGTAAVDRRDWGLEWNPGLEAGGVLAGWKVDLEFLIQLVQRPAQ